MALTKQKIYFKNSYEEDLPEENFRCIKFICPNCKAEKEINIPIEVVNNSSQLTTVSIPKRLICEHHFQAFIDKNFKVRGYQKVDFEIENRPFKINEKLSSKGGQDKGANLHKQIGTKLKEIYEEFWEFIDDNNAYFKEFIKKDKRRGKS